MVLGAFIYSRLYHVPLVVSYHTHLPVYVHSYVPWFAKSMSERLSWLLLRLMGIADLVLVTSEEIKKQFLEWRVVSCCEVWQRGIDTNRFHPSNKNAERRERMTNGHPDDFVMLYVGRIAKEKRLQDLREVLLEMEKHPKSRLCFVGTGPYHKELQNDVFKDFPNVAFLGELHGEELASTYASADVFVFPSDSETLGFVVLEAMASGLPVVAARAGGVPSLIQDRENSFLCTPGSTAEFVEAIHRLKDDTKLYRAISIKARQHTTKFDWGASMANLRLKQYQQAMANFELRWEIRLKRYIQRNWAKVKGYS
jgi:sulfoquinovosyltransferase